MMRGAENLKCWQAPLLASSPRLGTVVRMLLVVAALCSFVARYADGDWHARTSLFSSLAELALVLCGLWIILRGLVRAFRYSAHEMSPKKEAVFNEATWQAVAQRARGR
jgi:hypothetical protein